MLHSTSSVPTLDQWCELCCWLALTACRHPSTLRRGHQRAKELAYDLAGASSFAAKAGFATHIRERYGEGLPADLHNALVAKGDEVLLAEAEEVDQLSAQDTRLPMLSLEAMGEIGLRISAMNLRFHDAPTSKTFALGDTGCLVSSVCRVRDASVGSSRVWRAARRRKRNVHPKPKCRYSSCS